VASNLSSTKYSSDGWKYLATQTAAAAVATQSVDMRPDVCSKHGERAVKFLFTPDFDDRSISKKKKLFENTLKPRIVFPYDLVKQSDSASSKLKSPVDAMDILDNHT